MALGVLHIVMYDSVELLPSSDELRHKPENDKEPWISFITTTSKKVEFHTAWFAIV